MSADSGRKSNGRKSNVNVLQIRIFPRTADFISPFMTVVKDRIFFHLYNSFYTIVDSTLILAFEAFCCSNRIRDLKNQNQ